MLQSISASHELFLVVKGPLDPSRVLRVVAVPAPDSCRISALCENPFKQIELNLVDHPWLRARPHHALSGTLTPGSLSVHMILHDRLLCYGNGYGIPVIIQNAQWLDYFGSNTASAHYFESIGSGVGMCVLPSLAGCRAESERWASKPRQRRQNSHSP
jgi:hypothetical protein